MYIAPYFDVSFAGWFLLASVSVYAIHDLPCPSNSIGDESDCARTLPEVTKLVRVLDMPSNED